MMVVSPPNAGKNFFFDCIIHSCIHFGQIGNFTKFNRFPLMEMVQKRIVLWNEPNYEPGAEETLKTLFGGDSSPVKVKYQQDTFVQRTPIIVLSNNDIFPKTQAFESRMYRYTWRPAHFLKFLKKKPHPLSAFYLFLRYGCMNSNNLDLEKWEKDLLKNK